MRGFIKQDFVKKKWGSKQNFFRKVGGWSKRRGLKNFEEGEGEVNLAKKMGVTFLGEGGGSYHGIHYASFCKVLCQCVAILMILRCVAIVRMIFLVNILDTILFLCFLVDF